MWPIADFAITVWWPLEYSMNKARTFGYYGNVDYWKSLKETLGKRRLPR
jgi:hypothetical protein